MRNVFIVPLTGCLLLAAGCMSATKVQEMIDASNRDYLDKAEAHENSINVLKQSSVKTLEQNQEQAEALVALRRQMETTTDQMKPIQGNAEAAKVMSAANTVRVAELSDALLENKEAIAETLEKMNTIDNLFEEVMITHFQNIADSANSAIATLQLDDVASTNGEPAGLAEPLEIVAPDTAPLTNAVEDAAGTNAVSEQ